MLKKIIESKDIDGNPIKAEYLFNISPDDAIDLETAYKGGSFVEAFEKAVKTENKREIAEIFRELIRSSYGVRHENNIRFVKSDELFLAFRQTDAYQRLLVELMDFDTFKLFMDEVVDPEYLDIIKETSARNEARVANRTIDEIPEEELLSMEFNEFNKLAGPKGNRSTRTLRIMAQRKREKNITFGPVSGKTV